MLVDDYFKERERELELQSQLDYDALRILFDWPNSYLASGGNIDLRSQQCKSLPLVMKADDPRLLALKNSSIEKQSWIRNSKSYVAGDLMVSDQ